MAWQEVGGNEGQSSSPVQKWTMSGQVVEGVYRGQREGKYGPLLIIDAAHGEVVYGTKTVLKSKLAKVQVGDYIKVTYLGKRKGQTGTEYGDFSVQVDSDRKPKPVGISGDPKASNAEVAEFDRLVGLIKKEKGDGIAAALSAAAKATGDPIGSLRAAMDQIGVVPF